MAEIPICDQYALAKKMDYILTKISPYSTVLCAEDVNNLFIKAGSALYRVCPSQAVTIDIGEEIIKCAILTGLVTEEELNEIT